MIRIAVPEDLPGLREMYRKIVAQMECRGLHIWDAVYPGVLLGEDVAEKRLYLAEQESGAPAAAFALLDAHVAADAVQWEKTGGRACYLERLGVSPDCAGKGLGGAMLEEACVLSRARGAEYLRLFVAQSNRPAICLYRKNGFRQAGGQYQERIDDTCTLSEYGFERKR